MALPTRVNRNQTVDPFDAMQKEFDTMLGRLFNGHVAPAATAGGRMAQYFAPYGVDVREDADHLYVEAHQKGLPARRVKGRSYEIRIGKSAGLCARKIL
jgi:hypothetical protein